MIPISDTLLSLINQQIAHEMGNNLIYIHVSSWARRAGLTSIASFFSKQADGELDHAGWLRGILDEANAQISVAPIPQKPFEFSSCEEIAALYIETEAATTALLETICHMADSEYNIGVQDLMQKMLREQTEEEGTADRFANLVKLAGGNLIELDIALSKWQ